MSAHRHRAVESVTVGYRHPVGPPAYQDRRAHGAVCHVETCECGAMRETNTNGRYEETSGWYVTHSGAAPTYTVRPRGCSAWASGLTLEQAHREAGRAIARGLKQIVIVNDETGEVES